MARGFQGQIFINEAMPLFTCSLFPKWKYSSSQKAHRVTRKKKKKKKQTMKLGCMRNMSRMVKNEAKDEARIKINKY